MNEVSLIDHLEGRPQLLEHTIKITKLRKFDNFILGSKNIIGYVLSSGWIICVSYSLSFLTEVNMTSFYFNCHFFVASYKLE